MKVHTPKPLSYYVAQATGWQAAFGIVVEPDKIHHRRTLVSMLIDEEYKEWLDADDVKDKCDALVDLIWVASNFYGFTGIKFDGGLDTSKTLAVAKFEAVRALTKGTITTKSCSPFVKRLLTASYKEACTISIFHPWAEAVAKANFAKLWTPVQTELHIISNPSHTMVPSATHMGMYVVHNEKGKILKPPGWQDPMAHYEG